MVYAATAGVIIYWNPHHSFSIQRAHCAWLDEYNYRITIEYKHTTGSSLLQQYPKILLHNLYLLRLIPCELDITSNPFCNIKIITYKIDLPPTGRKIDLNLLNAGYFTIHFVIDKTPNLQADHQLPTQSQKNV